MPHDLDEVAVRVAQENIEPSNWYGRISGVAGDLLSRCRNRGGMFIVAFTIFSSIWTEDAYRLSRMRAI